MNAPYQIPSGPVSLALQLIAKRESNPELALQLASQLASHIIDGHSAPPPVSLSWQAELERILPLQYAAELQSTSVDTLVREDQRRVARGEPSQIISLGERRKGMRLKNALRLP